MDPFVTKEESASVFLPGPYMMVVIVIVILGLAGGGYLLFFTGPKAKSPLAKILTASEETDIALKTQEVNPFDQESQFVNPFDPYKSSFNNLKTKN
jgi:hypothetical protein